MSDTAPIPSGASQRRHNDLVLSFLALRRAIGIVGLFLPAALLAWAAATGQFPPTMSEFYYTPMSEVFVGSLSAIAVFLWSYEGYRERRLITDRNTARAASLGALGVALCPSGTELQDVPVPPLTLSQRLFGVPLTEALHYASAALFFLSLAVFCLVLFVRGASPAPPAGASVKEVAAWQAERREHLLYRTCGVVILAAVAGIASIHQLGAPTWLLRLRPVFWLEVTACVAFALSWLVKGRTLAPVVGAETAKD